MTWPARKPTELETALPAPVAMVFETPPDSMRAVPTPSPTEMPTPPTPPPAPPAPENAEPVPPPVTPPTQAAEPLPMPPVEPPPESRPPSPTPVPAPQAPAPPMEAPLEAPADTAEPLPIPPAPVAPPPPPARPAPTQPRPPPRVATAPPKFPMPQNYSFGPAAPARPGQSPAAAPAWGPAVSGEMSFGQFAKITQGRVDASWLNALQAWWDRNGYYPKQAAALGQDGRVRLEMVVDRYGKVQRLELVGRSGSQWLDLGALAVFRGAALPPFPPNNKDDHITLELSIDYILLRR